MVQSKESVLALVGGGGRGGSVVWTRCKCACTLKGVEGAAVCFDGLMALEVQLFVLMVALKACLSMAALEERL